MTFDPKTPQKVHLIAVGGAVMHNLALALMEMGHHVTGSDDAFYEPSKSRLEKAGIDTTSGWFAERVTKDLDLVILGMHARADNPELLKTIEMGIPVVSFPEFIGALSSEKTRIAVAGSHGKTTTTSMIMHVLNKLRIPHDYLVGAQLKGYSTMVRVSDAPTIILESDEYLSSCLDARPKMYHYEPQIAIITGIEWDHMNVFPTWESYIGAFKGFLNTLPPSSVVYYDITDPDLRQLMENRPSVVNAEGYDAFDTEVIDEQNFVLYHGKKYPVQIFGRHNMANMKAASLAAKELGIQTEEFLECMQDFEGAQKRMQTIVDKEGLVIIQDFAHAPSKVRSTTGAVRERYPDHHLTAVVELHTFSSLNPKFLSQYKSTLNQADTGIILYLPESSDHKKLPRLTDEEIRRGFGEDNLKIVHSRDELSSMLTSEKIEPRVFLMMSSGFWGGGHFNEWMETLAAD